MIILLLLLLTLGMVLSRPLMQRFVINDHEWEVPNEPGWEEVINDAEVVQQRFTSCLTAAECLKVVEEMRVVFLRHPVSKKYFETNKDNADEIISTIFKWG